MIRASWGDNGPGQRTRARTFLAIERGDPCFPLYNNSGRISAPGNGGHVMKAAYLEATGAPEVIRYGELPTPAPRGNEVLVKVAAAALNPIDTYVRAGAVAMNLPRPFVTGTDLAGTVTALGPGAKRFKTGDRVWGSSQGLLG